MRQVILLFALLASLLLSAQEDFQIVKGNCLPDQEGGGSHRALGRYKLQKPRKDWDATKTYKQLVILVEFADLSFAEAHDKAFYEKVFNIFDESAYEGKKRYGQGSVADYFRTQSGGKFNLQFDIVGPYKVTANAKSEDKYKRAELKEATTLMVADQTERDFSQYDWDDNGYIEQVVYVLAGPTGNVTGNEGYLHPNTYSFTSVETPNGKRISNCTSSTELWTIESGTNCGIGTICHEFTHSLGLPDIYPVDGGSNTDYSICDEWELMDGGNFTNYGWCPPNFTAMEKMLLGWQQPIVLTEPCTITGMKPVSEGGEVYQVKKSDDEYIMIENHQWTKWDAGLPGQGLVVTYVNYIQERWRNNTVNTDKSHLLYDIIHADGKDFVTWQKELGTTSKYANSGCMHKVHLSTSPYPYGEVNTIADWELSDITVDADGLVSFKYKGGAPSGIASPLTSSPSHLLTPAYFDLQGRRIEAPVRGQLYLVRKVDGSICKYLYK